MNRLRGHPSFDRGFTLTELAVVLVIVALVVGSMLIPLSTQADLRDTNDTRKAMAERILRFIGGGICGRLEVVASKTPVT